ncbi:hypothetical protein Tco_0256338 [Tanacetum coccineum]
MQVTLTTSVSHDSEPGIAFWGADDEEIFEGGIPRVIVLGYDGPPMQLVAPPSPDYIPGPEDPQTPPVPQDEDEPYEFPAESKPYLCDSPLLSHSDCYLESDPEEDPEEYEDDETEDGLVDYPIDGGDDGDDDDGDSSRDDANDEDEDEDEDEEEEEHLAPADYAIVVPVDEPVFHMGNRACLYHTPTDITIGLVEHLARYTAPAFLSPPPMPYPLLPSSGVYNPNPDTQDRSTRPSLMLMLKRGDSGLEMLELAELHEHDTQDLYALLEDAQDSRSRISQRLRYRFAVGLSQATHQELQTHRDHVYAYETHLQAHQTHLQLQGTLIQTQHQAELLSLQEQQRRARQPGPEARIPDHQDASRDADSHI